MVVVVPVVVGAVVVGNGTEVKVKVNVPVTVAVPTEVVLVPPHVDVPVVGATPESMGPESP